jgi:hypothetical protein
VPGCGTLSLLEKPSPQRGIQQDFILRARSVLFNNDRPSFDVVTSIVWSFDAAWRAALRQCAPSPKACRHKPSPCRAAEDPRRGTARAIAARTNLPLDKAVNIFSAPLHICRIWPPQAYAEISLPQAQAANNC